MPGSRRAASPGTEGKGLGRSTNTEKLRQARTHIPRHMHVHVHAHTHDSQGKQSENSVETKKGDEKKGAGAEEKTAKWWRLLTN